MPGGSGLVKGSPSGLQQLQRVQGIVHGDGNGHDKHLWIDGNDLYFDGNWNPGGSASFAGPSPWIDATNPAYGADPLGVADSATAIQAALTAAGAIATLLAVGAVVFLPPGQYLINSALTVPNKVILRGATTPGTHIKCGPSFPTSTAAIQVGTVGIGNFYSRVEDLTINTNQIAGSTGINANNWNEGCGLKRLYIVNYMTEGVRIETAAVSIVGGYNYLIEDMVLTSSSTATTSHGIHIKNGATTPASQAEARIVRVSIVPSGGAAIQGTAIWAEGGAGASTIMLDAVNIHPENHAIGVRFGTNTFGHAQGVYCSGATTKAVTIDTTLPVAATNINNPAGGCINDTVTLDADALTNRGFYQNTFYSGRFREGQGANVVAANDLTLGQDGNLFYVTGGTQINRIDGTGWGKGAMITLVFSQATTVKYNQASGGAFLVLYLASAADFAAISLSSLTLKNLAGNSWIEVGRKP